MKIVIELTESQYKYYANMICSVDTVSYILVDALKNGTPLPEHHGNLKDEREVVNILLKYAHSEEGRRFANFLVSEIKDAPTIIESDKEE